MNQPLVSVVVPTFNDSKYVKECISSIINQTYKNLDVVVVDDCSSDNTVEIVKSFGDSRIRIFENDSNKGAAYSRNRAIKECKGDFIAFLDGDDIWHLNKIEKQIEFMLINKYDFTGCYYSFLNEDGSFTKKYMSAPKKISHRRFLKADYVGCLTVVYKRDIFPDLEIPVDIYKRNDYALWLKLSEKVDCFILPEILASHRNRGGSISSGRKYNLIKYHKIMFNKLYGFNAIKSSIYAYRNALFYVIRRLFYYKKIKQTMCNN